MFLWSGWQNSRWYTYGLVLLMLVVLAFGSFLAIRKLQNAKLKAKQTTAALQIRQVESTQLPVNIPTDIPIEKGATVLHSYEYPAPSGEVQSVREFVSTKTVEDNFQLYKKYLIGAGWNGVERGVISQPRFKIVSGTKNGITLKVSIQSLEPILQGSRVEISVIGQPNTK